MIMMANRLSVLDKDVGRYIPCFLSYLQDERKFSLLVEKLPTERLVQQFLEKKYGRELTEDEFITYYKGYVEDYNNRQDIFEKMSRFGKTRAEILRNLGTEVIKSQELYNIYREFLKTKSGEVKDKDKAESSRALRNPALENRFNRGNTQTTTLYTQIKLEELDLLYLNILGLCN